MARWSRRDARLAEWETDLSRRRGRARRGSCSAPTTTSPRSAGWTRRAACSRPAPLPPTARGSRPSATGIGLLINGGSSRGNLLSGRSRGGILTVSRMEAEKRPTPAIGILANGVQRHPRTRPLRVRGHARVDCGAPGIRRDVRPRGHRGGVYPFLRGAMCVVVRDLIVYGVLTDMMRGRPAVYATFSSYDEVAHTTRASSGRTPRGAAEARPAVRPHRPCAPLRAAPLRDRRALRPRSDPGRDVQAAERLRARRARRALARGRNRQGGRRRRRTATRWSGHPRWARRTGRPEDARREALEAGRLRSARRRPRLREPRADLVDGGAPQAYPRGDRGAPPAPDSGAARTRTSAGSVRSSERGPVALGPSRRPLPHDGRHFRGRGSLAPFSPKKCASPSPAARTGSPTWPTSWSAASTTPISRRAARSRS